MAMSTRTLSLLQLFRQSSAGFNLRRTANRHYFPPLYRCYSSSKSELSVNYLDNGEIVVLGINRPEAKNAFSRNLVSLFEDALEKIRFDNNLRVLIVRSEAPGIFSAGADLKERLKMAEHEVAPLVNRARRFFRELGGLPLPTIAALDGVAVGGGLEMVLGFDIRVAWDLKERIQMTEAEVGPFVVRLRRLAQGFGTIPLPSIAAIDGVAVGGGLEMSLMMDMRVAATNAKMGLVETKLAIIPGGGGTQKLPRLVGPSIAKELMFTARVIDGAEAARIGLVNHCVEQDDSQEAAYTRSLALAREISSQGPIALRMVKQAVDRGIEVDLTSGLAFEEAGYAQVIPTKDRMEGLIAFKEKRKPKYKGE